MSSLSLPRIYVSPDQPNQVILDMDELDVTLSSHLVYVIKKHPMVQYACERHLQSALLNGRRIFININTNYQNQRITYRDACKILGDALLTAYCETKHAHANVLAVLSPSIH